MNNAIMFIIFLCLCPRTLTQSVKNTSTKPIDLLGDDGFGDTGAADAKKNDAFIDFAGYLSRLSNDTNEEIDEFTDSRTALNIGLDENLPMRDGSFRPTEMSPIFGIFNMTPTLWFNHKKVSVGLQDDELLEAIKSLKQFSEDLPSIITTPKTVFTSNSYASSIFKTYKELDLDNQLRNQSPVQILSSRQANEATSSDFEVSAEDSSVRRKTESDSETILNLFIDLNEHFPLREGSFNVSRSSPTIEIPKATPTSLSNHKDIPDLFQDKKWQELVKSEKNSIISLPSLLSTPKTVVTKNVSVSSIFETSKEFELDNQLPSQSPVQLLSSSQANDITLTILEVSAEDISKKNKSGSNSDTVLNLFIDFDENLTLRDESPKTSEISTIFHIANVTPTFWSNQKDIFDRVQDEDLQEPIKSEINCEGRLPFISSTPTTVVTAKYHVSRIYETLKKVNLSNHQRNQSPAQILYDSQDNKTTLSILKVSAENHSESANIETIFDNDVIWFTDMERNDQDDRRKMVLSDTFIIVGIIMFLCITLFAIMTICCAIANRKHSHVKSDYTESVSSIVHFTPQI